MGDFVELSSDIGFLIVDEAATFREILSHILKNMGFKTIYHAIDGVSALATLKRDKVGFIICERGLKKMSGMELLKEIRETPEFQRVPFMMMANELSKEDVILAAEFGIDGYLKKPFVMKDVSIRISAAMSRFLDPANTEAVFEEARQYYVGGNLEKSKDTFKKIKEMLPNSSRARVGLARCYRKQGEHEKAEKLLLEALKLNNMYIHAHHELGSHYMELEKTDMALKYFSGAIELSPSNPMRYESVADILMRCQRFKEAEDYLNKAVKLELVYPTLYEQLGKALFSQKKIQRAFQYFEKALLEQPDNPSFLNSMGICMKDMGKHAEAISFYNQALKHRPQDVKVLYNKVLCLMHMQDYERAEKVCNQIIRFDPGYDKAKNKLREIEQLRNKGGEDTLTSDDDAA